MLQAPRDMALSLAAVAAAGMRTQLGALCYRVIRDKPQILMITSRGTGRWIIPKGWPIDGLSAPKGALQEAYEEAGVKGRAFDAPIGFFTYRKDPEARGGTPCAVLVYPVKVKTLLDSYPEAGQRKRKWLSRKKAAARASDPELAQILRDFDPMHLRRRAKS